MSCCPSTHRNATSFLWHIGFNRSQGEVAGGGCGAPAGTGWQEIPLRAARGIAGMCAQVTDQHFGVLEGLLTDLADQQLLEVVIVAQRVLLALLGGCSAIPIHLQLHGGHLEVEWLLGRSQWQLLQIVVVGRTGGVWWVVAPVGRLLFDGEEVVRMSKGRRM